MSLQTEINSFLIADEELRELLADSYIDPTLPALYEFWAPHDAAKPYVNALYSISGDTQHPFKRRGELTIDIFTANGDTLTAEKIARRINKLLLQKRYFISPEDGRINVYKSTSAGGIIPEEDPLIVHWNDAFELQWWEKGIIE